jgi:CBS domain containing-hemolysin-like protein
VLFTPESRSVVDVLEDMKRTKIPLAIVVDEYGGTSGLVTLENLVEELVGDLQDELDDSERPRVERRADGTIGVGGSVPIDVIDVDGLDVPDDFDLSDTIGSLVVTCLERLARPGDRVRLGQWEIVVEDVRRRRVERVRLVPISQVSMLPPKIED